MPPCASIHSSQCAPSPCSWPCAPSWTRPPASRICFAPCAMRTWLKSSSGAIGRRRERASMTSRGVNVEQPLVLPDVRVLIPVVLAAQPAVADDQRRRVAAPALGEQRDDVLVELRHRQRVLDAGVAVDDHRLVDVEQRPALGHDHHLQLARRLDDHLARVAALLVVALDAERADRLQPSQVRQRIVVGCRSTALNGVSAP